MIIRKRENINNKYYMHTYSDSNLCIRKIGTNEVYEDAYDLMSSKYEYEETSLEIIKNDIESDLNGINSLMMP